MEFLGRWEMERGCEEKTWSDGKERLEKELLMGPGPFGAGDLFGGGCKTVCKIIEKGEKNWFPLHQRNVKLGDMRIWTECIILIKDYTLRTNEIKRYTYGINVMLWWIALCGLYNRNEQGKKSMAFSVLLLEYILLFFSFTLYPFQEQAGHPKGTLNDWCPGIMLIDFMVAYPGRRDEVYCGGAITAA